MHHNSHRTMRYIRGLPGDSYKFLLNLNRYAMVPQYFLLHFGSELEDQGKSVYGFTGIAMVDTESVSMIVQKLPLHERWVYTYVSIMVAAMLCSRAHHVSG